MTDSKTAKSERRDGSRKKLIDTAKIQKTLDDNKLIWIAPTIIFGLLGLAFALTKSDEWEASQALVVRDEAIGEMGLGQLGRFDSSDALKRSLETILQIAKNNQVIEEAMRQAKPEKAKQQNWPSTLDVESMRSHISVTAPKGTEFGATEVVYLSVTQETPREAILMTRAVCDRLETRMQRLRDQHAQSLIAELIQKNMLAERELDIVTREMSKYEESLGGDLGEMRSLADFGSGDSNLRAQVNQIKVELRQSESALEAATELHAVLKNIGEDTDALIATPNRLLESQPALRRLKDGLVDAQLRTARLSGGMTDAHPRVMSAKANEQNVRDQLRDEIDTALLGAAAEVSLSSKQYGSLKSKLEKVQSRLDELATQRAGYMNLVAKVDECRKRLGEASTHLSEARGRQEAARAASLITRMDEPVTGSSPVGPGRTTLVAGSTLGGLVVGLSLVYLLAPWQESRRGRRQADQEGLTDGRRRSDNRNGSATSQSHGPIPPVQQPISVDRMVVNSATSSVPESQYQSVEPLQLHSLTDAVTRIPFEGDMTVETSLDHLASILESKES